MSFAVLVPFRCGWYLFAVVGGDAYHGSVTAVFTEF